MLETGVDAGFWNGRSVFLTGHTGFKGAWLTLWLLSMGARVHGFSLPPEGDPNLYSALRLDDRVGSTFGDVNDLDAVTQALASSKAEIVLHLAAQALVRASYRDPVLTFRTNVMGTVNVLEAVRRVGGVLGTVVVTTDKCYENVEQIWSYREGDPLGGRDPYSGSKAAAEIAASAYARSFFGPAEARKNGAAATARAGNVLGGGDWAEDRLIPDIIRALSRGERVQIRRPDALRPWQHVLEPLAGYLMLAQRLASDPTQAFESWNFGPDHDAERNVLEVARTVCRLWGRPEALEVTPYDGPHEASLLTLDNTKARLRLGWRPRLPFSETLELVVGWYRREVEGGDPLALTQEQLAAYAALSGVASHGPDGREMG